MKLSLNKIKKNENINLTEGSILSGIIYFAIPILLSNFLQQFYNTADLMIVGSFAGKNPMAAVGATGSISNLLISLFLGLTTGASVVVAQMYGQNDREKLHNSIHTAYATAIAGGILLSIVGFLIAPVILKALNTPEEILDDAIIYMRIFFLGMTPLLLYNMGAGILRSVGDSIRPFNFLIVAAIVNVTLDLLFVAILKMSVVGAAIATLIAQSVSAVLVTYNLMKSERIFKLNPKDIKFYKSVMSRIFKIGIPTGIQSSVISLSNVLIQSKINLFGATTIAGFAAQERIDGFIFMSLNAVALAVTTFSSQNVGAGKIDRLKEGVKQSLKLSLVVTISLTLIGLLSIEKLMGIFTDDPEVIAVGVHIFRYFAMGYFIFGMSEVFGGFVRGAGYAMPPMIISVFSMCILRILWIYIALEIWFKIEIVILSYPISWTVTFILNVLYFRFGGWKDHLQKQLKEA
ncbi:MATE efflux family protein [Peptoniphilus sp. ING2-D1G]|nr:MATE efflux family protein [Peptoniphilus sp. ING2-D1G]